MTSVSERRNWKHQTFSEIVGSNASDSDHKCETFSNMLDPARQLLNIKQFVETIRIKFLVKIKRISAPDTLANHRYYNSLKIDWRDV